MPRPTGFVVWHGSKSRFWNFGGIPRPVSEISTTTLPGPGRVATAMRPGPSMASIAFELWEEGLNRGGAVPLVAGVAAGALAYYIAARILDGDSPADMPIEGPSRYELGVSRKAAQAIGLALPQSFLQKADRLI